MRAVEVFMVDLVKGEYSLCVEVDVDEILVLEVLGPGVRGGCSEC